MVIGAYLEFGFLELHFVIQAYVEKFLQNRSQKLEIILCSGSIRLNFMNFPKDSDKFIWTQHIKIKMVFYSISASQVRSILRKKERTEESIVPGLFASMKNNHKKNKTKEELWLMYHLNKKNGKIKLISVWRYPGVTQKGIEIEVPESVLSDIIDIYDIPEIKFKI